MDSIGPNTDYGVDPGPMKQAMFTFCDRGAQLVDETVNLGKPSIKKNIFM